MSELETPEALAEKMQEASRSVSYSLADKTLGPEGEGEIMGKKKMSFRKSYNAALQENKPHSLTELDEAFCEKIQVMFPDTDAGEYFGAKAVTRDLREGTGPKINCRGGLKELAAMLEDLEAKGTIDHISDKDAGELFTVRGAPVNPESLKNARILGNFAEKMGGKQ